MIMEVVMEELIIGSHVSFKKDTQIIGSINEAISYGASTFMFYTGAPQNTNRSSIDMELVNIGKSLMKESNIDINNVVVHAPYIINLANPNNHEFNINFLKEELRRTEMLGVSKLVLHPGSHVGLGSEEGIKNIAKCLNEVISSDDTVMILLETMAGKGSECGRNIYELKSIINLLDNKDKIGVCLDTCHLNDAGYDIKDFEIFLDEFDEEIGLEKIGCVHINDSKNPIGSHKDRHENIGYGTIGFDNLINVIYNPRLKNVPKILETPYVSYSGEKDRTYPPYKVEIDMIRKKKFNENLIEDIRAIYN